MKQLNIVSYGAGVDSTAMILKMIEEKIPIDHVVFADTVLLDGPYTPGQMKECYDSLKLKLVNYQTSHGYFAEIKNEVARITKIGGKVITFGYNSNGLGFVRGFAKELVLLIAHGAGHNDTIVTIEREIR